MRPVGTVTALALGAIGASYLGVRTGRAVHVDGILLQRLTARHSPSTDRVVGAFTDLGSVYALAGVSASLALRGRRTAAIDVVVAGAAAWTAAQAAKPLLRRPRPYELVQDASTRVVAVPAGSSWPSGHAALVAAMADTVGAGTTWRMRSVLALVTAAVGTSRCYVGVHHPSDVVAGLGVGILASRATRRIGRRVRRR